MQAAANILSFISGVAIFLGIIISIMRIILNISEFVFINLSQIILALNSRVNETQADTFAYEMGYGRELISGMYVIQKISLNANVSIFERMKSTHPHVAHRISHLERLENGELEE